MRCRAAAVLGRHLEQVELADAGGAALRDGASLALAATVVTVVTACVVRDPLETRVAVMAGLRDFEELLQLERLDLAGLGLPRLPERFAELGRLRELSLVGNKLAALPESFGLLAALEANLYLSLSPLSLYRYK